MVKSRDVLLKNQVILIILKSLRTRVSGTQLLALQAFYLILVLSAFLPLKHLEVDLLLYFQAGNSFNGSTVDFDLVAQC